MIVGGEGFIGRQLRKYLFHKYRVISIDKKQPHCLHEDEVCLQVDMETDRDITTFWQNLPCEASQIKAVVFLAAYYDFANTANEHYIKLQRGLELFVDLFAKHTSPQSVFVYSSSMAALAPTSPDKAITEISPQLGLWHYPKSKIVAENFLQKQKLKQTVVILVLAGVYSNYCELVPLYQTIELVRSRSPEKFFYPGRSDRGITYVHVEEVCDAIEKCFAVGQQKQTQRFLIGQNAPLHYREIHRRAASCHYGKSIALLRVPKILAYIGAYILQKMSRKRRFIQPWMIRFAGEHFYLDTSHAKKSLGWSSRRFIGQDLDIILQNMQNFSDKWYAKNEQRPW
ncbi:vitamin K epoxide reductase [Candidatus Uabimicrobium amorphum]|uniref:Vitamin K epoxide reductase n=1 Tax=Uabimicrobium amorphum TaxID=2596890 RepID=A0A5S9F6Q3_UABAM|nr:vitamin K epoxide reductase [Candidatus Uabimicrobium amorphum]